MAKKIESKLDQYAERLDKWFTPKDQGGDGLTLYAARDQLALDGCSVSLSALSRWWTQRERNVAQNRVLASVASGARQCEELDRAFKRSPAPELETLIKLFKSLILQLTIKGESEPAMLKLADQLSRTTLEYISGQTKAAFKREELDQAARKLQLAERRAAQAEQTEKVLTDAELTPEQRAERIKEIYGR